MKCEQGLPRAQEKVARAFLRSGGSVGRTRGLAERCRGQAASVCLCRAQTFRLCAIGSGEQSRPFESGERHHVCILESSGKKEKPDQAGKSVVRKGILLSGALDDTNLKILWRGGGAASSWAPGSVGQWGLREFRAFGGRRLLFPNK